MAQVEDWITIGDFSPGMFADWHESYTGLSTAAPRNGAATTNSTYRCTADGMGALVPLPKATTTYNRATPMMDFSASASGFPSNTPKAMLLDAVVAGPVVQSDTTVAQLDSFPEVVYLLYGLIYDVALGTSYKQYVVGKSVALFNGGGNFDFVFIKGKTVISSGAQSWPSGSLDKTRATVVTGSFIPSDYRVGLAGCVSMDRSGAAPVIVQGAIGADAPLTDFDTVVKVDAAAVPLNQFYGSTVFTTPNISNVGALVATPTKSTGSVNLPYPYSGYPLLVTHQGRIVYARRALVPFWGSGAGYATNDYLAYTPAGDFTGLGAEAIYGEEDPSPIGAMLAMSANELLVVKHYGGGLMIRGDLDNPDVFRLPLIHGTGGYTARPVGTPSGVYYASRHGIIRWNGGETSEVASAQLGNPLFWVPQSTGEPMEGMRARLAWWDPYVVCPNNYLLNTQTGGWWRLDNEPVIPYSHYDVSAANGSLYAFRYKVEGSGSSAWWSTFAPGNLASSYSWKSQPLIESLEREANYAEIEITAQRQPNGFVSGTATITTTLTGYTSEGLLITATNTFTLQNNANPQTLIQAVNANFVAKFVQLRVVVDSGNTSMAAPKIFSIRVGRSHRGRTQRN